jgi:hypothetical protein
MLDQENTYQKNYPEDGKIGYDNAAQIYKKKKGWRNYQQV